MSKTRYWELVHAAAVLLNDILGVKRGESIVVTADSLSDETVVEAITSVAHAQGAKVLEVWMPASPRGVGKQAEVVLPVEALSSLLSRVDVWVELNYQWLHGSTIYERATSENRKLRYMCMARMGVEQMTRLIGEVNLQLLRVFQDKLVELMRKARYIRMRSPAGTDVAFERDPSIPVINEKGEAFKPGTYMVPGQVGWVLAPEGVNGVIIFDWAISPPFEEPLREPIRVRVEKGVIRRIDGGKEARIFEKWLESFKIEEAYKLSYVCIGVHPRAKLTPNIVEAVRVWATAEWGIGAPPASLYAVGVSLDSSLWLDNVPVLEEGRVLVPELAEVVSALQAP
jgi:leucyl aminopeptidase (aminopeptidase T)